MISKMIEVHRVIKPAPRTQKKLVVVPTDDQAKPLDDQTSDTQDQQVTEDPTESERTTLQQTRSKRINAAKKPSPPAVKVKYKTYDAQKAFAKGRLRLANKLYWAAFFTVPIMGIAGIKIDLPLSFAIAGLFCATGIFLEKAGLSALDSLPPKPVKKAGRKKRAATKSDSIEQSTSKSDDS